MGGTAVQVELTVVHHAVDDPGRGIESSWECANPRSSVKCRTRRYLIAAQRIPDDIAVTPEAVSDFNSQVDIVQGLCDRLSALVPLPSGAAALRGGSLSVPVKPGGALPAGDGASRLQQQATGASSARAAAASDGSSATTEVASPAFSLAAARREMAAVGRSSVYVPDAT